MEIGHPCICFFPALPLTGELALGDWIVGDPSKEVAWRSERFKGLVEQLLTSFDRQDFSRMALLWHRDRGFDGSRLSSEEFTAIQTAVRFAALDANDRFLPDDPNKGHHLVTAENGALYMQPIDEENGFMTHVRGGLLREVLDGGWKIGQKGMTLPDAVVSIRFGSVPVSSKLAKAVFEAQMSSARGTSRHIQVAVEWHGAALVNPRVVTLQQRLIALKTGFESLLGTSDSRECARRLRTIFETSTSAYRHFLPWSGILWSPNERTALNRQYTTKGGKMKTDIRSELEDWFMTLAEARNSVIHDGILSMIEYRAPPERPLSRYSGHLFWIGERLLREAIKASLGPDVLLCGLLRRRAFYEQLYRSSTPPSQSNASPRQPPVPEASDDVEPSARDLGSLLRELHVPAANHVLLSAVSRSALARIQKADAMGSQLMWAAKAGAHEIAVNEPERRLLEAAGAEMELSHDFMLCD